MELERILQDPTIRKKIVEHPAVRQELQKQGLGALPTQNTNVSLDLLIKATTRSTFTEVLVNNTNVSQLQIPRQAKMDRSLITSVSSFQIGNAALLPVSGVANVSDAEFNSSFLTLQDAKSNLFMEEIPLSSFEKTRNAGIKYDTNFQMVNFEQSFITARGGLTANTGFLLAFDYIYLDQFTMMGIDVDDLLARFKG